MRHPIKARPIRVEADAFREDRLFDAGEQRHFRDTGGFGMNFASRIMGRVFRGLDQSTQRLQEIRDSYRQLNFEMYRRQLRSFRNQY